ANHMVAQYMFDNVVSRSTPDQANELGHALGMPEFGSKSSREQVLVLVNLRWNLFLGPQENTRSDPTKIHALDRIYIKRFFTSTEAMDPRTELGLNISKIMFSTGSEIRRKERGPEDPFQDEEAKMIRLCLAAAKKIHEAILGVDGIDPNYANWVQRDGKWRKISTAVHKRDIDHRITISDNIIGSDIISIADLDTYSLVNTFFQFKGGLSKYYENTIKQRGKLPPDRINAITQVAVERFEQLQRLRGNFAAEAPEIATTMRRNLLQIRDIDPKKLADNKDVVETYTRLYFERFAKIDPKALADAFVGWDSKYNQWVEKSLVDSGGYSKEDAKDIVEKATQKINSLDANERKNLENSIKKYMQDDEYSTYRQYVLSYVRSFTPMETGELYIQVASNFFDEPGTLPQRLISQAEAKQLEQTIRIRAGIHQAIGGRSQKELITRTEETIRHQTGKNLVDYIRDSLRVEDKLVFSQLCQYGHILQETQGELRSEGPLSLQKTDQLKEAIHLRVNHLDPDTRGKLMSAIREHTGKSQSLKEYVEDCLAELRKP
ncbi:MAG TPA: hypothetical protein VK553_06250, partial [Candidatus Nitrosopolaris rasttigaisensis]|nr:hypothetical protein [Candidatus Nitrosopolaris rasttigaisensis]